MPAPCALSRALRRCAPRSRFSATCLTALALAACSGGSSDNGSTGFRCGDAQPGVLCLENCNLGCSTTGCGRTDIAQNEVIVLTFSENIDPRSVNTSSILFRTPTGADAVGEYYVNDNRVEFVPTLSISGGLTFYGFTTGETYVMTIVGDATSAEVVRGTSGRRFAQTLSCTLESRRGIIDFDQAPPRATLVAPAQATNVPRDTAIKIEFSELIDLTPFLSGTQSPVRFRVRRTRAAIGGGFECNPGSVPQVLSGSLSPSFDAGRGVTVLTFVPTQPLPANACIEIDVTDMVSDLSGRSAAPQSFLFETVREALDEARIIEDFADDQDLDRDRSAASWQNGACNFAAIGGDGRHGPFSLAIARDLETMVEGRRVFELDCDLTVIPIANTTTGAEMVVNDGRFFFTEMVVPSDVLLRFTGSSPPVLTVAGRIDINGRLDLCGTSQTSLPIGSATPAAGQPGAAGGVFGGRGGSGGDQCLGTGSGNGAFDGRDGEHGRLLAGHAYLASRIGSGGSGSTMWPASGLNSARLFGTGMAPFFLCISAVAGGGGGGSWTDGEQGRVLGNNFPDPITGNPPWQAAIGPAANGGTAVQLLPYSAGPGNLPSSLHFLVGGAGGGGTASNATFSLNVGMSPAWAPGAGGGGGGGAIALRTGRSLRVGPSGAVLATGGSTPDLNLLTLGVQAVPGGAGAGGSIVLQSAGEVDLVGSLDVRGGRGGQLDRSNLQPPQGGSVQVKGGDGSPGYLRLETPQLPSIAALPEAEPPATAANLGQLVERDVLVACQSRFYPTGLVLGPEYDHYEITALVDGVPMTFSDDPAIANGQALPGTPLQALFQAADLDIITGELQRIGPWRQFVRSSTTQEGIATEGYNSCRFRLIVDRTFAQSVVVQRVEIVYLD